VVRCGRAEHDVITIGAGSNGIIIDGSIAVE
jgi:hypothetical protein